MGQPKNYTNDKSARIATSNEQQVNGGIFPLFIRLFVCLFFCSAKVHNQMGKFRFINIFPLH